MLRIHVLRPGGHAYYVEDLVPGRAEGTRVSGEPPGEWSGRGADDLRLAGVVTARDLGRLLDGAHPGTDQRLRAGRRDATAGFDLTFCAPKSVSLLHLLAPGEMAAEVGVGHARAVADALGYLERSAAGVRRRRDGEPVRLGATGLVAGTFLHRTSRVLDPHLHSHVVVANVAHGLDGDWSALDGRRLFRHATAARALYHARLRAELADRLGVAWRVPPSGMGDVVGVDPTLCRLFSGRTADITEHVQAVGRRASPGSTGPTGPMPSRRLAALITRPAKEGALTVDELVERWRERALEFGYPTTELTQAVGLGRQPQTRERGTNPDHDRLARRLGELADHGRWLSRSDVVAEVAAARVSGALSSEVEAVADRVVGLAAGPVQPVRDRRTVRGREPRWAADRLADAASRMSGRDLPAPGRLAGSVDRALAGAQRAIQASRTHEHAHDLSFHR